MAVRNIDSSIFALPVKFWQDEGATIANLIRIDALNGIFQNGMQDFRYSPMYARYKANAMKRLTTGKPDSSGHYFHNPKAKIPKGKTFTKSNRLSGFEGTGSVNTDVSKVNMTLTGQMFARFVQSAQPHPDGLGVTLSYDPADRDKVYGNAPRGYVVLGIRKEIQDKIVEDIIEQLDPNIRDQWSGTIEIT